MRTYTVNAFLKHKGVLQGLRLELSEEVEYKGEAYLIVDISLETAEKYGVLYSEDWVGEPGSNVYYIELVERRNNLISTKEIKTRTLVPCLEDVFKGDEIGLMRTLLYSEDAGSYSERVPVRILEECSECPFRKDEIYEEVCGEHFSPYSDPPCVSSDKNMYIVDWISKLYGGFLAHERYEERLIEEEKRLKQKKELTKQKRRIGRIENREINSKITEVRQRHRKLKEYINYTNCWGEVRASIKGVTFKKSEKILEYEKLLITLNKELEDLMEERNRNNRERNRRRDKSKE